MIIYDATGNVVHKSELSINQSSIDVSILSKGLYLVQVITEGASETTRIIKE